MIGISPAEGPSQLSFHLVRLPVLSPLAVFLELLLLPRAIESSQGFPDFDFDIAWVFNRSSALLCLVE
jgi:hypothetical protein